MRTLARLYRWRQRRAGLAIAGLLELVVVYGCASWAIDSGRLLAYFLGLVALVAALQNCIRWIRMSIPYPQRGKKA